MNVVLVDKTLNTSLFEPSGMFLGDFGDFDSFALDDLEQHDSMADSHSIPMSRRGSTSMDGSEMFNDQANSPIDQPATSTSTDSERSADPNTKMRRRAQNRASQRAFRERKEKHLRSLKMTLDSLGERHRKLFESYSQQSEAVMKLKGHIAELHAQIAAFSVQSERDLDSNLQYYKGYPPEFHQFDAFSFSSKPTCQNALFWQNQPLDSTRVNMFQWPESDNLPGFEDLLNLP